MEKSPLSPSGYAVNQAGYEALGDVHPIEPLFSVQVRVVLWNGRLHHRGAEVGCGGQALRPRVVGKERQSVVKFPPGVNPARVVPAIGSICR